MTFSLFENFDPIRNALDVLAALIWLGGAGACLAQRRLSPMLSLAGAGFIGLMACAIFRILSPLAMDGSADSKVQFFLASATVERFSSVGIVAGLWFAFQQIRRELALSLEPRHGRD